MKRGGEGASNQSNSPSTKKINNTVITSRIVSVRILYSTRFYKTGLPSSKPPRRNTFGSSHMRSWPLVNLFGDDLDCSGTWAFSS